MLLGGRGTCENNLPRVPQQRGGWDLNLQPVDRKSGSLTTGPPSHMTFTCIQTVITKSVYKLYVSFLMQMLCAWNRDRMKFDTFARDRLSEVLPMLTIPSHGTVFDYFIDSQCGICIHWNERSIEEQHSFALSSSYVAIPEVIFSHWHFSHTD